MSNLKTDALEDYNPFGDPLASATVTLDRQPAFLPPADTKPPPYSVEPQTTDGTLEESHSTFLPSGPPVLTVADLQRRQRELDAIAAQLDLQEKETQQREAWRLEHGYSTAEVPNWPAFPRWCCFRPIVHIDFNSDIPSNCRWMARYGHYFWMAYCLLLLLNIFGTLSYLIASKDLSTTGPLFGVSIAVFFIMSPASFFSWNRPLYKALKKNSSMQFCIFFPFFGIQILIIGIQLLGIDYLGACGWINSLKQLSENRTTASFMLFIAALFTAAAAAAIFLILRVHMFYRNSGSSFRNAKQELAHEVVAGSLAT
nr:secretory carrier associated membrane protein 1 [Hymenolepis microstoma]